jgi:sodium transport system permease protein
VPISRLVVGKWLAAWSFAIGVAFLTLGGFAAAASLYAQRKVPALTAFGAPELVDFTLVVIPFAAMTAALQMLICTYGRSYREAQTYVSYVATAMSFVPVIAIYSGLKDAFWQLAVPVLGQQMVLTRVIRGDVVAPLDYAMPAAIALAIAAVCLTGVTRLLGEERIVFGRG